MPKAKEQSTKLTVAGLFEKLWPNLRFLGLGIILAWIHLEADFVSSMAAANPGTNIMAANGIWLYGGMLLTYGAFAVFREHAIRWLDRRSVRMLILALSVVGAACVIVAFSPQLAGTGAGEGSPTALARVLFAVGVAMLGIVEALTLVQCARLYLPLEPGEVLFFSLMAQLLMFVLYNVFNSYSAYVVWSGGPTCSSLLGVCLLPLLSWGCMFSRTEAMVKPADASGGSEAPAASRSLRDLLRLPSSERESLSPSFRLLLLTIFIITGTVSTTLNGLMVAQPPTDYLFDAQLAMLFRFLLVLVLFVACFTVAKHLSVEKIFWVGSACIAALPALLLVLGASTSTLVLVTAGTLFLLDFFIWIVLILAAQTKGENALLLFTLGQAASCAGILLGTVLGSSSHVSALLTGNRLAGACLMLLVVLVTAVLLSEQRIREILGGIAKDGLNVRNVLDKPAPETALPPTRRATLWAEACRTVGERALLSEREQEILRQLADNRTPQDTADYLCISLHTVRTHTRNVYAKLGVHSRDELIALVRKEYESLK